MIYQIEYITVFENIIWMEHVSQHPEWSAEPDRPTVRPSDPAARPDNGTSTARRAASLPSSELLNVRTVW